MQHVNSLAEAAAWLSSLNRVIVKLKIKAFYKKVEAKYHGKNIEFVSISVDTEKDYEKWKKMVVSKELGGIQLFADKNWTSDFVKAFGINSIPRFILIGPDGKVIKADAARPSSASLTELLDGLVK